MKHYPFDDEHRQADFELAHLLTNEVISDRQADATEEDRLFYQQWLTFLQHEDGAKKDGHMRAAKAYQERLRIGLGMHLR